NTCGRTTSGDATALGTVLLCGLAGRRTVCPGRCAWTGSPAGRARAARLLRCPSTRGRCRLPHASWLASLRFANLGLKHIFYTAVIGATAVWRLKVVWRRFTGRHLLQVVAHELMFDPLRVACVVDGAAVAQLAVAVKQEGLRRHAYAEMVRHDVALVFQHFDSQPVRFVAFKTLAQLFHAFGGAAVDRVPAHVGERGVKLVQALFINLA